MYGHNTNNQAGMSFNIMGANKPKKLEQLTHPNIKKFKSDFTNYHHETNGQATLQGHISDEVVAVIDSLLGAKEEYHYLLCHGGVEISYLSEEQRGLRPWLRTADPNNWGRLLEALLVLKPPGGAYQTQTYDHLMTRAEASHLNFAYDHQLSGEDKYIEKLLESERVCSMAQFTNEQIRAYFSLLIVGSKVSGSQYKGLNVHPKSRDPQDVSRVEVMKEKAMLTLKNFKKTRQFVDWIILYISKLREAVSALESFQGKVTGVPHTKGGEAKHSQSCAGYPQEESILVLQNGAPGTVRNFPKGPCKGCVTSNQHRTPTHPAVMQQQCPLREHPDWNGENVPFSESVAGRKMKDLQIPFINAKGLQIPRGATMDRLSPAFRVMLDGEGMPVKLEPPVKYRWQGDKGGTVHPTSAQAGESKRVSPEGSAGTPQHVTTGNPRDMDRKRGRSTIHACCMTCSTPQQIEKQVSQHM
jgi:hypothetical protein